MPDINTKANITIGNSVLEFSGSEAFVQKQIDEFKQLIFNNLKTEKAKKTKGKSHDEPPNNDDSLSTGTSDNPYPNVIDYHGENVGILKVKGQKAREKTRNLVLMYCWAKKQIGVEAVHRKELVALCEEHECFDQANFKTTLKKASGISIIGSKRDYSIRLTVPGVSQAKKLLDTLEEESIK